MLRQYTNWSGETYEEPHEIKICFRNKEGEDLTLTIRGIGAADCRRTLDKKLPELRAKGGDYSIEMNTPELANYYRLRENFREFLDIS